MDVDTATTPAQADLWVPQSDAGSVSGHDPHRLAVAVPPLNHWKAKNVGVEILCSGKVALLEHELANAANRNSTLNRHYD